MDREEIYAAIRAADAAGDGEAVRKLSAYLDSQLPSEAAETPQVKAEAPSNDGQPRGTFFGDFAKGLERIGGTVGNLFGGDYKDPVRAEELADIGENMVRSTTAPLGGDYIAAAASAATGKGYNPEAQRARREELANRGEGSKVTATAGELLGAGGVGKVLAPAGGGIIAQGAATGAVTGANESGGDLGETARAAATGALGGKALEKLGEAFSPLAALAKRIKANPNELAADFQRLRAALGRPPTVVELVSENQARGLTKLAEGRKGAMEGFSEAQDVASAARPARMAESVERGQSTTGRAEIEAARDDAFTAAMNPIRNNNGVVGPNEVRLMLHPDVVRSVPEPLRARLTNAVDTNRPVFATVGELDSMRRALGRAAQTAERDGFDVEALRRARATARLAAERISPPYRRALADYEGRSDMATGAATGEGIRSASPGDLEAAAARMDANTARGVRTGARKAISEAAGASNQGALRTARELQEPGMRRKTTAAFDDTESARLAAIGEAEHRGAENLASITRRGMEDVIDPSDVKKIAGLVATGIAKTKSPGLIVQGASALLKPLQGLGLAPGVGRKIAELATSENGAQRVIDYLRRAKVGDTAIQNIARVIGIPLGAAQAGQ